MDISYESTCKIDECVLYYKIKDNYTENVIGEYAAYTNELDGIKRLQVFRFYEDMNVLLPVETEYDVEKDTVICNADLPGTYCLLDMELWLENIGFVVEEPQNMIMSLYTDRPTTNEFINANMTKVEYNGHTYGIYSGNMEYNWDSAEEICESLGGHLVTITNEDEQVFIEKNLLKEGTKNSYWIGGQLTTNGWKWQTGEDFSAYTKWTSGQPDNCLGQEDKLMMYRNTNPLCTSGRFGYWNDLNNSGTCKGESFFGLENFGFICEWENPHITEYILIFGHTLKKVYLNDSLSPNNSADTDKDGLLDWAEVKSEYAAVDENGRVHFLKLVDFVKMGYDILGWKRLENSLPGLEEYLNLIEIVPCNSDPTVEDTDGDGLLDGEDPYKLQKNQYDRYDRESAVNYALEWCKGRNPEFREYPYDCANFVSQCLFNGYISMNEDWHCYYNGIKSFEDFMLGFLTTESERFFLTSDFKYVEDWDITDEWNSAKEQYRYFSDSRYCVEEYVVDSVEDIEYLISNNLVKIGDLAYVSNNEWNHALIGRDPYHAAIISKISENDILYAAHTDDYPDRSVTDVLNEGRNVEAKLYIVALRDVIIYE